MVETSRLGLGMRHFHEGFATIMGWSAGGTLMFQASGFLLRLTFGTLYSIQENIGTTTVETRRLHSPWSCGGLKSSSGHMPQIRLERWSAAFIQK